MKKSIFLFTLAWVFASTGCSEDPVTDANPSTAAPMFRDNGDMLRFLDDLYEDKFYITDLGGFSSSEVKLHVEKVWSDDALLGYIVHDLVQDKASYLAYNESDGMLTIYVDGNPTETINLTNDPGLETIGFSPFMPEDPGTRKLWGSQIVNCHEVNDGDCTTIVCDKISYIFWIQVSSTEFVESTDCP